MMMKFLFGITIPLMLISIEIKSAFDLLMYVEHMMFFDG